MLKVVAEPVIDESLVVINSVSYFPNAWDEAALSGMPRNNSRRVNDIPNKDVNIQYLLDVKENISIELNE